LPPPQQASSISLDSDLKHYILVCISEGQLWLVVDCITQDWGLRWSWQSTSLGGGITSCPDNKKLSNHQLETHTNGLLEEYSWLILTVRYSMLEFVTVSNAEIELVEKFWA